MSNLFKICALSGLLLACRVTPPDSVLDAGSEVEVNAGPPPTYTWHRDVKPLVQKHCQSCHTEGGAVPFALNTYEEAKARHAQLASAVRRGSMPPWKPSLDCQKFTGARVLTPQEKTVFETWSAENAPLGSAEEALTEVPLPDAGLEWVDQEVAPAVPYIPSTAMADDYRCFMIQPNFTQAVDLVGFDIAPGNREWVHHVILFSGDVANAQALDDAEEGPGWTCFGAPGTNNPQMLGGWVPGTYATRYPEGTGIRIAAGKVLVMQVHYNTAHGHSAGDAHAGTPKGDLTRVQLQFSKTPIPSGKRAVIFPLLDASFEVPPKSTQVSTSTSSQSFANGQLRGMLPHMHTHGRQIKVELNDECLIDIPQWDFNWQQQYFYEAPIAVRAGDRLKLTCTWDNPTDKTLRWGEGTEDEMCLNFFYFTAQ